MQEVLVYSIWTTLHLSQPTIVCNTFHVVKCMWGAWFFSPGQKEKKEDNPLLIRKRLQWSLFHHTPKPSKSLCSQQSHPDLTSQTLECFESFLNVPSKICLQIYCEILLLLLLFMKTLLLYTSIPLIMNVTQYASKNRKSSSSKTSKSHYIFYGATT